jgi:hypothetical protein
MVNLRTPCIWKKSPLLRIIQQKKRPTYKRVLIGSFGKFFKTEFSHITIYPCYHCQTYQRIFERFRFIFGYAQLSQQIRYSQQNIIGISAWLLWPVVYLFGSLIKVCAVTVGILYICLPPNRYQHTPTLPFSIPWSLPRSRKNHHQVNGLSLFFLMVWVEAVRLIGR